MENGQQPAFAFEETTKDNYGGEVRNQYYGLTKREYFAAMAMQGMLANSVDTNQGVQPWWHGGIDQIANNAVEMADALLKALDSPPTP